MATYKEQLEQAIKLHKESKFNEAEKIYKRLIMINANNFEILYYYGILAAQQEDYDITENLLRRAVKLELPQDKMIEALGILAKVLSVKGKFEKAIECHQKILKLEPDNYFANYNIANRYLDAKNPDLAIHFYKKAIELKPENVEINLNLAKAYKHLKDYKNAISCFKTLIDSNPNNAEYYFNLGTFYFQSNDIEMAIKAYKKALSLDENYIEPYINLGNIYHALGKYTEALELSLKALQLTSSVEKAPVFFEIFNNLANIYIDTKKVDDAIHICEEGLKIFPENEYIQFNLSRAKLLKQNTEEGWEYFKHRRLTNENKQLDKHIFDYNPFENKKVYVYADSDLSDTLHFLRYLPLLNQTGCKVLLKVPSALEPIVKRGIGDENLMFENIQLIPEKIDDKNIKFDLQTNLSSLPYLFGSEIDKLPFKSGYLKSDEDKVNNLKSKLFNNNKLKVGIIWNSTDYLPANISNTIKNSDEILPILKNTNVEFYSFNNNNDFDNQHNINSLGKNIKNIDDIAACVQNLDLIITIDNSIAHLAGALNKKAWLMLPYTSNWRWFTDRTDSPWYDSLKLFRQTTPNDWTQVINTINTEFKSL